MMKDDRTVPERIDAIRRKMRMIGEFEAVREKYGETLKGSDTVPITIPLDDLEIDVYGYGYIPEHVARWEFESTPFSLFDWRQRRWNAVECCKVSSIQ
jgi:hypothetical protein